MDLRSFLFQLPSFETLETVSEIRSQFIKGSLAGLGFNVAVSSELLPAGLAFSDGVVGWVIGKFDDGSPAFLAIKGDGDLVT